MNVTPWMVRIGVATAANAVMSLIAAALVDEIEIKVLPFVVAVAIFTLAAVVVKPVAERLAGTVVVWLGTLVYDVVDDKLIAAVQSRLSGPGAGPQGSAA